MDAGIDLDAAIAAKFNATSEKNGLATRLSVSDPAARTLALEEAARNLIAVRYDTYTARNGKLCSIEGDDGEKAWIVPFDAMADLESALSSPDHADAGKVEGDGIERSAFNRGYVMACSNIVNLHGPDVNVAEGFAQLCISKDELKSLNLDDYDQRAIDELEEFWGADKLFSRPLPSAPSEGAE